jgi:hypothetical protein
MVATFLVDGRRGPSTNANVEVLVLVVVATHGCGGEGYNTLLATRQTPPTMRARESVGVYMRSKTDRQGDRE